jgi:hypothetical protein
MVTRGFVVGWVFLALAAAGVLPGLTGVARGAEPEWVEVDTIPDHSLFTYDKKGVARPAKGMLGVVTRLVYLPVGKEEALEVLKHDKKYEGLSVSFYSYDIDCKGEKSRLTRVVHRDGEGQVIAEYDMAGKTEWEEIPPGARLDVIREAECK